MAFCGNCGTQLNDGAKFCPRCGQTVGGGESTPQQQVNQPQQASYQQPQQAYQPQQQSYQQPAQAYQPQQQQPVKPDSHMILAILSTLFCCLPTGIYAIILANKVDSLYYAGDYNEAEKASSGAKTWSFVGAGIAVVGWILYIIFFGGLAFLGAMAEAA